MYYINIGYSPKGHTADNWY